MGSSVRRSLVDALDASGVRLTRHRRVLAELLDAGMGHLDARDLLNRGRELDPTINRATVYRTIALLKKHRLIDELDLLHLEGEKHYYERRGASDHVHIGCDACGMIVEFETDTVAALVDEVKRRTGFSPESVRIEVRARCPSCHKS